MSQPRYLPMLRVFSCLMLFVCLFAVDAEPFSSLREVVSQTDGGWDGSKQQIAKRLNELRRIRGERFSAELVRFVGDDVASHYWCSVLITKISYCEDLPPLRELAMGLLSQCEVIIDGNHSNGDKQDPMLFLSLSVLVQYAILAESSGFHKLAQNKKRKVDLLLKQTPDLVGSFPVLGKEDRNTYDCIQGAK